MGSTVEKLDMNPLTQSVIGADHQKLMPKYSSIKLQVLKNSPMNQKSGAVQIKLANKTLMPSDTSLGTPAKHRLQKHSSKAGFEDTQ